MLGRRFTNAIQMFCVCWDTLYIFDIIVAHLALSSHAALRDIVSRMFVDNHFEKKVSKSPFV